MIKKNFLLLFGVNLFFFLLFLSLLGIPYFIYMNLKDYLRVIIAVIFFLFVFSTKEPIRNLILFSPILISLLIRASIKYHFIRITAKPFMYIFFHITDFYLPLLGFILLLKKLNGEKVTKDPLFHPFMLIFFSYFISSLVAIDHLLSLLYIFFFLNGYILYRLTLNYLEKDEKFPYLFMFAMLFLILMNLFIGLIQFKGGKFLLMGESVVEVAPGGFQIRRPRGVFIHANSLAEIIGIYLPFLFTFLLSEWEKRYRGIYILLILFFFVSVFVLYTTHSRNGYISAFVGLSVSTFLLVIKSRKFLLFMRYTLIIFLLIIMGYLVISKISPFLIVRLKNLLTPASDIALYIRLQIWKNSLLTALHSPFTGIGVANFPYMRFSYRVVHAHNIFINLFLENGILGVIGFFWLYLIVIKRLLGVWRKSQGMEFLIVNGLLGGWVVYLFHNLFDTAMHVINHNEEMKVFFIFLAITIYFTGQFFLSSNNKFKNSLQKFL